MKPTAEILKRRIQEFIAKYNISSDDRFLVAYSGGPDSTALLSLLNGLFPGRITAMYIDHGIRDSSEMAAERKHAELFCKNRSIPLEIGEIGQGFLEKKKQRERRSLEELAREYRYALLGECAVKLDIEYICLGHNRDDLFETMIMRFFQGAAPAGLYGFEEKRDNFLRPLAGTAKNEILAFLSENHLEYSLDSSNSKTEFLRNKVRQLLVPVIEEIFPGYGKSLLNLREKLAAGRKEKSGIDPSAVWKSSDRGKYTTVSEFNCFSDKQKDELLYYAYNEFGPGNGKKRLPYRFLRLIHRNIEPGPVRQLLNGHDFVLTVEGDRIFYRADIVDLSKKRYLIVVNSFINSNRQKAVEVRLPFSTDQDVFIEVSEQMLEFPVFVRTRLENDMLQIADGKTAVKKMISSFRIPPGRKMLVPVIQDKTGILAVAGSVFGEKTVVGRNYYTRDGENKIKILIKGRKSSAEK